MATWAAGLIAMLVLLVLAAAVAAKRVPRLVAKLAVVSIITATIAGTAFLTMFPSSTMGGSSLDRGAVFFVVAIALGITAAILVLRAKPVSAASE